MKISMNKKISGLSLLEALMSTAIVGIGFVAILQMTNYSVQSIYTSGERTKANYLTNMIAEDVIGHKNIVTGSAINFSDYLFQNEFNPNFCDNPAAGTTSLNTGNTGNVGNIYGNDEIDGPLMKQRKWEALLNNKNYLNCKGTNERRNFRVFKLGSQWSAEPNILANDNERQIDLNGTPTDVPYVTDDLMYIGRIQMNLNDGKKRKYLYFQTDYVLK